MEKVKEEHTIEEPGLKMSLKGNVFTCSIDTKGGRYAARMFAFWLAGQPQYRKLAEAMLEMIG